MCIGEGGEEFSYGRLRVLEGWNGWLGDQNGIVSRNGFGSKPGRAGVPVPHEPVPHETQVNRRMKPVAGRSGERKCWSLSPAARERDSAARYPLRTAPSMVAGHPVAVQSPARKTRGQAVMEVGRWASMPGRGE